MPDIQTEQPKFSSHPSAAASDGEDEPEGSGTAELRFPREHLFKVKVTRAVGDLRPLPIRELPDWPEAD